MSPTKLRKNLRELIREHKNKPCSDCGREFHYSQMSYDHVRGVKEFNLGGSILGKTETQILAEIAKCDVVCLCCHARREMNRASVV